MSTERVSVAEAEKAHLCRGARSRKGSGTSRWEVWYESLEVLSIRSGAESTGGCVKLKAVTEIRRNQCSARDTFIADSD